MAETRYHSLFEELTLLPLIKLSEVHRLVKDAEGALWVAIKSPITGGLTTHLSHIPRTGAHPHLVKKEQLLRTFDFEILI